VWAKNQAKPRLCAWADDAISVAAAKPAMSGDRRIVIPNQELLASAANAKMHSTTVAIVTKGMKFENMQAL
jgi:hypothetical protein